jgi:hypothetical protein
VWSGFTKFIRSQTRQQRCVYFSLLGSFTTIAHLEQTNIPSDAEKFCFIPDIKFLDNGKFKHHSDECNINPYADSKLKKINVSPTSIAHVCSTTSEVVTFVLKDIIAQALKMCKEGICVKLNFKIGYLSIYNYKVCFETMMPTSNTQYSNKSINRLIGRRTNKSFGGNGKLVDLSARTSVKTPGSCISMYSGRSKNAHASNPNPQAGSSVHPNFNKTMYDSFMGYDSGTEKRDHSVKKSMKLPFPFVSGMVGGHSYTKPGKRVFFTKRPDNKGVLQYQLQQIDYNQEK